MKINFLLGSGVSYDTLTFERSSVKAITTEILTGSWNLHTSNVFEKSAQSCTRVILIQNFLKKIVDYNNCYLINKRDDGNKTNYEDLYFLLSQLEKEKYGFDNLSLWIFEDWVYKKCHNILYDFLKIKEELIHVSMNFEEEKAQLLLELLSSSLLFISSVTKNSLTFPENGEVGGFNLLKDLYDDSTVKQINIFTLNHDTLIEQFLEKNCIKYSDGFAKEYCNDFWEFNNDFESSNSKVRIFKLHGSINWYFDQYYKGEGRKYIKCKDHLNIKDKIRVSEELEKLPSSFLTGYDKHERYIDGMYGDLYYQFHKALLENNRLLVSGYGFGDYGMNRILITWLDRHKENQLILLHKNHNDEVFKRNIGVREGEYTDQIFKKDFWFSGARKKDILELMK